MKDIKVSILCTVFNHEKFLNRCLEGFVNQKTNFDYEIIVHDDCSNDNSRKIIEEFTINYPDLMVPMYESENQFSKGVNIVGELMYPIVRGKYIACCEGDDYWNDDNKLQRQFEYMEKNEKCYLCTHNTIIHDLLGEKEDTVFNRWESIHKLNDEEAFIEWDVHTSSYMFRKKAFDYIKVLPKVWCGDYARLLYAYSLGEVVNLPYTMSVYNYNNTEGMTYNSKQIEINIQRMKSRAEFLEAYDKYTENRFAKIITKRLTCINFDIENTTFQMNFRNSNYNISKYKNYAKKFRDSTAYKLRIKELPIKEKIRFWLIVHSYYYAKRTMVNN